MNKLAVLINNEVVFDYDREISFADDCDDTVKIELIEDEDTL